MKPPIPIVYCFDVNYSNYAAVSIYSLFRNAINPIKIYCLVPLSELNAMNSIEQIRSSFGIDISIIGVNNEKFSNWKISGYFSPAVYLRLVIPDLINERKVIYLDSDTLILGDLAELFDVDLTHNLIAGAEDINKGKNSNVPRTSNDCYVNSGVMLLNLDGLRQDEFLNKCNVIYSRFYRSITLADQCIINKYAESNKTILDEKWNRQIISNHLKREDWQAFLSNGNSMVLHFITEAKPWKQWCCPFIAEFWWNYANQPGMARLQPIEANNINQLISLAASLDLNENFKEASNVKDRIIRGLMGRRKAR